MSNQWSLSEQMVENPLANSGGASQLKSNSLISTLHALLPRRWTLAGLLSDPGCANTHSHRKERSSAQLCESYRASNANERHRRDNKTKGR